MGDVFDAASVGTEAESISGDHGDRVAIGAGDGRPVRKSVTGIDPSIVAPNEIVDHAMCVAVLKGAEEGLFAVSLSIAIAIGKPVHVRDAVGYRTVKNRINTDGDIQCVAEVQEFIRLAIVVCVFENRDAVRAIAGCSGEWILE